MSAPAAPPSTTPNPVAPHPSRPTSPSAATLRLRLAILAALLLLADVAVAGWLLSPYAPSRAATQQQLEAAQSQLSAMRNQDRQLRELSSQVRVGQEQTDRLLNTGMPEEAGASSQLLFEIQRIAGKSDIDVSTASFHADPDVQAGLRRLTIQVGLNGSYNSVVRFINQIEQSPIFFIIDQVNASSVRSVASATAPVRLQVELEAYERSSGAAHAGTEPATRGGR